MSLHAVRGYNTQCGWTRDRQCSVVYMYIYICTFTGQMVSGRVGYFLDRKWILSGIQFTWHFIKFVVVGEKESASDNPNVILTRQTFGQLSCMSAGSKCQALAFDFSVQICCMFLKLKCRRDFGPGLYTTSGLRLAKRMQSTALCRLLNTKRVWSPNLMDSTL